MKRLLLKRRTQIEQDQRAVTVMARWLAGKHVRERYRAQGVKVDYIDPVELANAPYALADKGIDLRAIQEWLGHRSIEITVRYTRISQRRFSGLSR